jgi:hypothetical protein
MAIEVPQFIRDNASRGLEYNADGKGGEGMTDKTIREARDMADGSVSEDKVRRMGPWFARHRVDMDAPANDPDSEDFPGKGAVAWLIWGGSTSGDIMDAAKWAERIVERLDKEKESASAFTSTQLVNMDTIENQLAAALTLVADGSAAVTEAREHASKLAADNMELTAQVAKLVAELETAVIEKDALASQVLALEATKTTASIEAAKIAASVGVEPIESSPSVPAEKADILATYLALTGAERSAFYVNNSDAIKNALRK